MLQVESYLNQIEIHKNHMQAFSKCVLNACCLRIPARGPGVRAVSFKEI